MVPKGAIILGEEEAANIWKMCLSSLAAVFCYGLGRQRMKGKGGSNNSRLTFRLKQNEENKPTKNKIWHKI